MKNKSTRPNVSDAYKETEAKLTDKIEDGKGVKSKAVSRKELDKIAEEAKEQKFKAKDHGITADTAIKTEYMLKRAMKAGYTAAALSVVMQLAPEILKAIDYLIKHGEIEVDTIHKMGTKGIIGQSIIQLPVLGYLLGSLIGTSFCVDTGFTCFGLVEQNYELQQSVLDELGVEIIPIPRTSVNFTDIQRTAIQTAKITRAEYETVSFTVLRRGVIGVNKVGYA